MTYDIDEHLFICLFAICVSLLVKCLLRAFAHSQMKLLVFLLLNFKNSLHILFYLFIYFLLFLGPLPWHMEVPRLGVELEP